MTTWFLSHVINEAFIFKHCIVIKITIEHTIQTLNQLLLETTQ